MGGPHCAALARERTDASAALAPVIPLRVQAASMIRNVNGVMTFTGKIKWTVKPTPGERSTHMTVVFDFGSPTRVAVMWLFAVTFGFAIVAASDPAAIVPLPAVENFAFPRTSRAKPPLPFSARTPVADATRARPRTPTPEGMPCDPSTPAAVPLWL